MRCRSLGVVLGVVLAVVAFAEGSAGPLGDSRWAFSDRYPVEIPVLGIAEARLVVETGIDVEGVNLLGGPELPGVVRANVNEAEESRLAAAGWTVIPVRNLSKERGRELDRQWAETGAHDPAKSAGDADPRYDNWYTMVQLGNELSALAAAYPNLVQVASIGNSVQGKPIWVLKLSDNVADEEAEPEFKFTSSIHGDEVTGMELCRLMIHYLLDNYGTDPSITNLVDNAELWFCPMHNPDGYTNHTRYNYQGYDLNREFPDPVTDPNNSPAGRPVEVQHMMNFQYPHNFVLGANYHGGALVMNFPWDCRSTNCPDHEIYWPIAEGYSNLNQPMWNGEFYHGWTVGGQWYVIHGGFQDWAYNWERELHITIEISNTKWPSWSQMPTYWNQNRDAMLWYMNRVLGTGVKGIVTDGITGLPLAATVTVNGIGLPIESDLEVGDYHRLLNAGTYQIVYTRTGYEEYVAQNVVVVNGQMTVCNVQLYPVGSGAPDVGPARLALSRPSPNPLGASAKETRLTFDLPATGPCRVVVCDVTGRAVRALLSAPALDAGAHDLVWDGRDDAGAEVPGGVYWIRLDASGRAVTQRVAVVR